MSQRGSITQTVTQQQRLTQQQLRFVRLLEMNAPELEDAVAREMEENPALAGEEPLPAPERENPEPRDDDGDGDDVYYGSSSGASDYNPLPAADNAFSLYDSLMEQLHLSEAQGNVKRAAEYIIGNLDGNGYLRRSVLQIADDIAIDLGVEISREEVDEALRTVQGFDPPGIAAVNLQQTLLLQLQRLPSSPAREAAIQILTDFYEEFTMKHTHKMVGAAGLSRDMVKEGMALILTLNPKPGGAVARGPGSDAPVVVPDFIVENHDSQLTVTLDNRIPALRIDESFEEAIRQLETTKGRKRKKGSEFVTSRYNEARDFIRILEQRQRTLMNVMAAILDFQKEFFLTEDVTALRPMVMKDIAAATGYDISAISRATNNKYLVTPWGEMLPMKYFFSDEKGETEKGVTDKEIEAEIRKLVEGEDKRHPLSDDALQKALEQKGYEIKRRTVAKYRDRMGIPVARLRKENF